MKRIGYQKGEDIANNVVSYIERHAEANPERRIFLSAAGAADASETHQATTYGEFTAAVDCLAGGLADLGITKGDRALLFLPMTVPMYLTMTALQRLGAAPVFLDSWARRDSLGVAARVTEPRVIISFRQAFDALAAVPELDAIPIRICAGAAEGAPYVRLEDLLQSPAGHTIVPVASEDTALVTFTTGSSGEPKGANRTHRFLAAQHEALAACLPYGADDVDLPTFPIFSLNNIASGTTTLLPAIDLSRPSPQDPEILVGQIVSCGATCTTLSPSLFNGVSAHCLAAGIRLDGLRRVVTGGAPVSEHDQRRFRQIAPNAEILILYGSTEVEPIAHIAAEKTETADRTASGCGVDVGPIHPALTYKFIQISRDPVTVSSAADWKALEAAPGEPGELIVAGEHVCQEYFNNPGAFKRAKIKDVDGTLFHRTGDIGRLDSRGHLWIEGRVHNAICRDGVWVFPVQAEILLNQLDSVTRAAYLGIADAALGERCVCVIVRSDETPADPEAESRLRAEATDLLATRGMPVDDVVFRERIPLDPRHHSKVEYDVLRTELQEEVSA